jgi:hypothetical protein
VTSCCAGLGSGGAGAEVTGITGAGAGGALGAEATVTADSAPCPADVEGPVPPPVVSTDDAVAAVPFACGGVVGGSEPGAPDCDAGVVGEGVGSEVTVGALAAPVAESDDGGAVGTPIPASVVDVVLGPAGARPFDELSVWSDVADDSVEPGVISEVGLGPRPAPEPTSATATSETAAATSGCTAVTTADAFGSSVPETKASGADPTDGVEGVGAGPPAPPGAGALVVASLELDGAAAVVTVESALSFGADDGDLVPVAGGVEAPAGGADGDAIAGDETSDRFL